MPSRSGAAPLWPPQLIGNDLVDEFCLMLEPILLGGGKRLFPDDRGARPLELVSTTASSTGVLVCTYLPVRRSGS
jgi:dihydrofolate reductase